MKCIPQIKGANTDESRYTPKSQQKLSLPVMAKALAQDELFTCHSNPFNTQTSDRTHFPSFEAALAHEESTEKKKQSEMLEQDDDSKLNWSIETLAELKPMTFSPLSQQEIDVHTSQTPLESSSFFEDERQYEVLRTPLPVIRSSRNAAGSRNRKTLTLTTSPSTPMKRHRRHRTTMAQRAVEVRENQWKADKLLPPSTPKRSPRQRSTPSLRSFEPADAVTRNSEWEALSTGLPKWSASPIATLCTTSIALHTNILTPSPLMNTSFKKTPKQRSKLRLSFGLSPITLPLPKQTHEQKIKSDREKNSE